MCSVQDITLDSLLQYEVPPELLGRITGEGQVMAVIADLRVLYVIKTWTKLQ